MFTRCGPGLGEVGAGLLGRWFSSGLRAARHIQDLKKNKDWLTLLQKILRIIVLEYAKEIQKRQKIYTVHIMFWLHSHIKEADLN